LQSKAEKAQADAAKLKQKTQEKIIKTVNEIESSTKKLLDIENDILDSSKKLSAQKLKRLEIQREIIKEEIFSLQTDKSKLITASKQFKEILKTSKVVKEIADLEAEALPHRKKLIAAQKELNKFQEKYKKSVNDSLGFIDEIDDKIKEIPIVGDFISKSIGLEKIKKDIENKIGNTLNKTFKKSVVEQRNVASEALKGYDSQINKLKGVDDAAANVTDEVSNIGSVTAEGANSTEVLGAGLETVAGSAAEAEAAAAGISLGMSAATLGIGALVAGAVLLVKKFIDLRDASIEISRAQGLSNEESKNYLYNIKSAALDATKLGISLADSEKEMSEISNTFGNAMSTNFQLTKENLQVGAYMMKNMQLTAEEATHYQEALALSGTDMQTNLISLQDEVSLYNDRYNLGLRQNDVAKSIASATATTLANYKRSQESLIKNYTILRKYKITYDDAQHSADALLNIEQSIADEMEARVLTGKNINLNQARYLALQGDTVGAMQLMLHDAGSYEEIEKMLPFQREKLAAAMGMTQDQLLTSLKTQQTLSALTKEQIGNFESLSLDELKALKTTAGQLTEDQKATLLKERTDATAAELTKSAMTKLSLWVDTMMLGGGSTGKALTKAYEAAGVKSYQDVVQENDKTRAQANYHRTAEMVSEKRENDFISRPGQDPISFNKDENDVPLNISSSFVIIPFYIVI
ncbi:hypothetical protein EBR43_11610, partial [bacterium]|nr:hypothetical protein [bacterium]